MGLPSDGGEEAVAPRVPPVPVKPTQAEQGEHYHTGHAAHRSWCEHCVRGRGRVSPHVSVPEGESPEVGVDNAYMGPEGSQVTILVCKCKRTGCLAATHFPEGMNANVPAFFTGWLRGLGWKRLGQSWRFSVLHPLVWKVLKRSSKRALKRTTQRMDSQRSVCARSQNTDSSAEESLGRKTQESAGLG